MKQVLTFLLILGLLGWAAASRAQDGITPAPAASVYNVADVAVDVTADSAAKARDQAIAEAQRTAFKQLLERLGAESSAGAKLSDNDLATLVQNFEVENERASSVRYIGTFDVQFRPSAVRNFLGSKNASYNDAQGKPVVILPVVKDGSKTIMWEEPTVWQKAWSAAAHNGGLVPILIPAGDAEDQKLLSTTDAVLGKSEPIKYMTDKYQADGAVVAVLDGSLDNPAAGFTVHIQHFGNGYDDASEVENIKIAGTPDKNAIDTLLKQAIKQIRYRIEKEWKEPQADASISAPTTTGPAASGSLPVMDAPSRLPVIVPITTLAEWTDIEHRLLATPGVRKIDVTSLGRGAAEIELGFAGKPEDIQFALAQRNMRMTQDILSGQWTIRGY